MSQSHGEYFDGTGSLEHPEAVRVLISYAHENDAHSRLVEAFWRFLRAEGVDARLDVTADGERQFWPEWMSEQVRAARFVLVIASSTYRDRGEGRGDPSTGRGVRWESRILQELIYRDRRAGLQQIVPVVLPGSRPEDLPDWVLPFGSTVYRVTAFTSDGADALLRLLTDQPLHVEPALGPVRHRPPQPFGGDGADPATPPKSAAPSMPAASGSGARVWQVPARNPHFSGRTAMLDELHHRLEQGLSALAVQALYGLGGVGKTQLAIEYAHRYADDYDLVWWIAAQQPVLIPGQFLTLATRLGLPVDAIPAEAVNRVLTELGNRGRWLLVFDNAEHPTDIAGYRPAGAGHVLVTSRTPGWGALGGRIEVDVLDRSDTVALLRTRIPELTAETADKLAAELGDLPLAAAQAAGYLEQTALPAADYLRRFRARRAELLAVGDVLDYQGRVDTTWAISLERLHTVNPAAVVLLEVSAFLAPEPIPLSLFTEHPDLLDEPLRSIATDPDALADVVGAMVGYSLARRHRDGYQLHRLLQTVIRNRTPLVRHEAVRAQVVALLTASYPGDTWSPAHWQTYARLAPHVIAAGHWGDDDPALRRFMFALNVYQGLSGVDVRAQRLATEELHDRWQQKLGADDPDTLRVATNLIFSMAWMGEHDEACTLGKDTLQRMRHVLGPDHHDTLRVAFTVAYALAWMGEHDEACTLGKDTLQRMRLVLGPDHHETLLGASTVASALAWMGEHDEACTLVEDTLHRTRRTFGADASETLRLACNMAVTMALLGQEERARVLVQDTLQRAGNTPGADHSLPAYLSANLALVLIWPGVAKNPIVPDDTLQSTLRALGPGHGSARRVALYLEFVLTASSSPAHVCEIAEDSWQRTSRAFGPDHLTTQYVQAILALALARSGEPERASALASSLCQESRDQFAGEDLTTVFATAALTIALIELGQPEQAQALAAATVQPALTELGQDHPLTPTFRRKLTSIGRTAPRPAPTGTPAG